MKLYYTETMNPRRACSVAKFLQLPVEYVRVDLAKGEHQSPKFVAMNPNAKVPVLVDGNLVLWESLAIMVHLATKAGSPLWPAGDPTRVVEVMRWLCWDLCHFAPHAGAFYFEHLIKPKLLGLEPNQAALDAVTPALHTSAKILDAQLAKHEFIAGPELSIADFSAGVLLPWADEIKLPVGDYRNLQRWHESLMKLPGFGDPWPS